MRLVAMAQMPEDDLPSRIAEYEAATGYEYGIAFPKEDVQRQVLTDTILQGDTAKIKTGLIHMGRTEGVAEEVAPLIGRLDAFEKECGINTYMVYRFAGLPL